MKRMIDIDSCRQGITLEERIILRQLFDENLQEDRIMPWSNVSQASGEGER